jgi:RNA polymerase sigma-70 factor (ECF subfamily)
MRPGNRRRPAGHVLDVDRLDELHRAHAPAVRAYALRRTDSAAGDEACAEVWAVCWRRLEDVPDDALPWLFGVARRVLANQRRRERRLAALRERLVDQRMLSPATVPPPRVPADPPLARALARLRPTDREALLLVAWEGLTPARAAVALGVRPGTFAVRLHRARTRLADALDAERATDDRAALVLPHPTQEPAR